MTLLETAAKSDPQTQNFALRNQNLGRFRLNTDISSDGSYLLNWLRETLPEDERATPENDALYAAYAERIGDVDEEIPRARPTVENYCHHLIQASFLKGGAYLDRMKELASHPYLLQEFGRPLATNPPPSVPITRAARLDLGKPRSDPFVRVHRLTPSRRARQALLTVRCGLRASSSRGPFLQERRATCIFHWAKHARYCRSSAGWGAESRMPAIQANGTFPSATCRRFGRENPQSRQPG